MKSFISALLLMASSFALFAQYPSNMNNYTVSAVSTVSFTGSSTTIMEIPPWQIPGTWHTYFFSTGAKTYTYADPNDMISHTSIAVQNNNVDLAVQPDLTKPWKRNYFEIYSTHYFNHATQGPINIGFCHGENKNICGTENTINPNVPYNCTTQGNQYDGYYAMVSGAWTTSTLANNWGQTGFNNEMGPIMWPANGFIAPDNASATEGIFQPSSIISGDWLYIFVYDNGPNTPHVQNTEGRGRGIKVLRVTLENSLDPTKYQVYYKDPAGNVSWLPSLPAGFTKETMLQYTRTQGPKSTDIIPDELTNNTEAFRFSVAQVNNQNYFIACEEYIDNNDNQRHHVALRFSYDLVNWSAREKIVETSTNWNASQFNYPIFLSSDGWSNTAVNLNSFYVIGVHSQSPFPSTVNRVNISLNTPPPPPPPPNCGVPGKPPCIIQSIRSSGIDSATADDPFDADQFNFYPNPATGGVNVQFYHSSPGRINVTVFDVLGRNLKSVDFDNEPVGLLTKYIEMSKLNTGTYFIRLTDNSQNKIGKIVKK